MNGLLLRMHSEKGKANAGQALVEYGIIITLLSATLWAVFATWEIWGWGGHDRKYDQQLGEAAAMINEEPEPDPVAPPPEPPPPPPPPPPPSFVNDGGTFTATDVGAATMVNVRYMGANAGLAGVSSLWMRVRSAGGAISDVQLTNNNTGAQRDLVANRILQEGDDVSFFLRVKPRAWSQNYYNWMLSRGRLTGTGNSAYYDVFSSASTGPNNVTTVTKHDAGTAGNVFGSDEFHIGFEDLALDWGGCDRDYNDAEIRISIFDVEEEE